MMQDKRTPPRHQPAWTIAQKEISQGLIQRARREQAPQSMVKPTIPPSHGDAIKAIHDRLIFEEA